MNEDWPVVQVLSLSTSTKGKETEGNGTADMIEDPDIYFLMNKNWIRDYYSFSFFSYSSILFMKKSSGNKAAANKDPKRW